MKELLAQLVPDVLDGVEFRCVGRQLEQIDVVRCLERITAMPTGTIDHHDNALIGVACRDLVEEELHAASVDVRQYQTIELAGANIHCAKNIGVLMGQHALAKRTDWFGCPTPAHVRGAPEARLVLKHQLDG